MALPKRYNPREAEPRLNQAWQQAGVYHYSDSTPGQVYSIDTPPATVSGELHLGHVYSYSHADFLARFYRMSGYNVFYPMGYDDNGLPTERLVEKRLGISAGQIGGAKFIEQCLQLSEAAEKDYQALWQRLGLSIDWRHVYRTIDDSSRRAAQHSFIDLYHKGLVYRRETPAIWCPECRTSIAQAELDDLERKSEFITLVFSQEDGSSVPVATTRPELLPACVAVFIHPEDERYRTLVGKKLAVPLFGQIVPVLEDRAADPQKGSGVVMCCTFGDSSDVAWWYKHGLPLVEALASDGTMTQAAGRYAGLQAHQARQQIIADLQAAGLVLERRTTGQSVRVHERCDTPVEFIVAPQWFIRLLDFKQQLLEIGDQIAWHPEHMHARYRAWVENLNWDWCISRQRTFGVPFPLWYCTNCGEVRLADVSQLPIDPAHHSPSQPCGCGSTSFIPERDVMDTWATSSLSPQIAGGWLDGQGAPEGATPANERYQRLFPFSLRPQAHDIIRTWAFYTIAKSYFHFASPPWKDVLISGWGIAGEGMGKISKSRGGGPMSPDEMIDRYSADAVRYWAASTGAGKDAVISEGKIQMGAKLATKLWNVARFAATFLDEDAPPSSALLETKNAFTLADRWILARTQQLIRRVTALFQAYDYAAAKSEIETFFWRDLSDNYLEMCKQRLYGEPNNQREAARFTLYHVLQATVKLLAPFLPFVTEEVYQGLFAARESRATETGSDSRPFISIHQSCWPAPDAGLENGEALAMGDKLIQIASAVRRFKSEHNLTLGSELARLQLAATQDDIAQALRSAELDLASVCRARVVEITSQADPQLIPLETVTDIQISIER